MALSKAPALQTNLNVPRSIAYGEKRLEELLKANGSRSQATVSQYVLGVGTIHKALTRDQTLSVGTEWIRSRVDAIIQVLQKKYPNKSSLSSKLTPLLVICRLQNWDETHEIYY